MIGIAPPPLGVGPIRDPGMPELGRTSGVPYVEPPASTTETADWEDNPSVVHNFTIYPWSDRTHEYIEPGMLLFLGRFTHPNAKFKRVHNMAPLWKVNIDSRDQYFKARDRQDEFVRNLGQLGERILEDYHVANKNGRRMKGMDALKGYYDASLKGENRYLTRLGILSHWNFIGSCLSKGESTGALSEFDMHQATDMVWSVGVTMGRRADISNIWGRVHDGDHLLLVLKRMEDKKHFQWIPYIARTRAYPPLGMRTYRDPSGRLCEAFVLYVGLCVASREAPPSQQQMDVACGLVGTVEQAHAAYGTLPWITVELQF